MPPLKDITDPGEFLPPPPPLWHAWWFWLCVVAAVLLLAAVVYFIFRKKPERVSRRTLLDEARKKLKLLKKDCETTPPETLATRVSLVIRRYMESAFNDPALFETDEEFTLREHALRNVSPELKDAITSRLKSLSELKYSPASHPQPQLLVEEAEALFAEIELHP